MTADDESASEAASDKATGNQDLAKSAAAGTIIKHQNASELYHILRETEGGVFLEHPYKSNRGHGIDRAHLRYYEEVPAVADRDGKLVRVEVGLEVEHVEYGYRYAIRSIDPRDRVTGLARPDNPNDGSLKIGWMNLLQHYRVAAEAEVPNA